MRASGKAPKHVKKHLKTIKDVPEPIPKELPKSTTMAIKTLTKTQKFTLDQLEFVEQTITDALSEHMSELVYAYLDKEPAVHISPENALRTMQELALRYATHDWKAALRAQAKRVCDDKGLVLPNVAELFILLAHGRPRNFSR